MFPSEWLNEAPEGYRDEFQLYTLTQALTASQSITTELAIDTPGNCNYYWRAFGVFLYAGAGRPAVRMRDSEGHMMLNTRVRLANGSPFGRQDYPTPLPAPLRMIPGAKLTFDFREVGGAAGVTVLLMIHGVKRWPTPGPMDGRGGSITEITGGAGAAAVGGL